MQTPAPNINYAWASLLVEEFIRQGVTRFCISPGSRSSPLSVTAAAHPRAECVIHFDERGLGFYALGLARGTGRPAVVITTSGSASGNLLPAVIEAAQDGVPMIVLTADRPPELRDVAAKQAIDQVRVFGSFARWFHDLPCPDTRISPAMVLTTVDHAVARSTGTHPGPVHLNCMFREPLAPVSDGLDAEACLQPVQGWLKQAGPYTRHVPGELTPSANEAGMLASVLQTAERGLIVVAGQKSAAEADAIALLSRRLGWPVFADILSGLRHRTDLPGLVRAADLVLNLKQEQKPDVVLQFGAHLTSKRAHAYVIRSRPRAYVVVDAAPIRIDPDHAVTHRVHSSAAALDRALAGVLAEPATASSWLCLWQDQDARFRQALDAAMGAHPALTEPGVVREVARAAPEGHALFFASSMPVRYGDSFAHELKARRIAGNRGASGIDGNLATGIGYADGNRMPVTVVIGDLALLHDLNSLALVRHAAHPVIIVVINNDGGGIFSFLPIRESAPEFDRVFGTPHGCQFAQAAAQFGIGYRKALSPDDFAAAYRDALAAGKSALIEVATEREANLRYHRQLFKDVQERMGRT